MVTASEGTGLGRAAGDDPTSAGGARVACTLTEAALTALRFDDHLAREIARFRDVDCPKDYPETAGPLGEHRRAAPNLVAAIEGLGAERSREVYADYHRSCAVPVLEEISTGRWKEAYALYHRYLTRLETTLLQGEEHRSV